jgi:hypothetical protein
MRVMETTAASSQLSYHLSRRSCDSCRFRKVKCNRQQKMDEGEGGCSFCSSLGLACKVSPPPPAKRAQQPITRKGKRLRAILDSSHASTSVLPGNVRPAPKLDLISADAGERNSVRAITGAINDPSKSAAQDSNQEAIALNAEVHFLNIPGLSRVRLDRCIRTFFSTLEHSMPLSYTLSDLWPRYQAFLDLHSGLEVSADGTPPLSELLLLAIACRGCDNTNTTDQQEMGDAIIQRFLKLANAGDSLHLAGLDGIEAINLLSERAYRPRYPIVKGNKYSSKTRLDVLGRGFSTELALSMQLQMPPPHCSEQEAARRRFLFWTIFMHDTFISVAACHMYRIMDEEVGWQIDAQAAQKNPYGYAMHQLALIARRVCRELMSFKAKSLKIHPGTVLSIMASLQEWYDNLASPFHFDWDYSSHQCPSSHVSKEQSGLLSRRSFMLCIYLSLHLNVWASVQGATIWNPLVSKDELVEFEEAFGQIMLEAFFKMAALARYCKDYSLVDHAPNNLRNVPAAWLLWCTRQSASLAAKMDAQRIRRIRDACQDLVDCVASAQSCLGDEGLGQSLQGMLDSSFRLRKQKNGNKIDAPATAAPSNTAIVPHQRHLDPVSLPADHSREGVETIQPDRLFNTSPSTLTSTPAVPASDHLAAMSTQHLHASYSPSQDYDFNADSQASLSPDWEALNVVTAEVQAFLAGFGFEMP